MLNEIQIYDSFMRLIGESVTMVFPGKLTF